MRLFTFMPLQAYKDTLKKAGRYVCDYSKTGNDEGDIEDNFAPAYAWLAEKMSERIGPAPDGVEFPVWAWYRNTDYSGDLYRTWGQTGSKYVKIELEIAEDRLVFTDFDEWHCVLNDGPCVADDENFDSEWDRICAAGEEAIRASWDLIFTKDAPYVQATFWELRTADIVSVTEFVSEASEYELEEDEESA